MKKFLTTILTAVALFALPALSAQNATVYTANTGVSLFTGTPATKTFTTAGVRLPTGSGQGILTIVGTGITGSPSGCTVTLSYQANNSTAVGAVAYTASFTPGSNVQTFGVMATPTLGDNYVATYACSSTYPTAGTVTASLTPITPVSQDVCAISPKTTVSVAISTATTTQLVALAAGKIIHVCGLDVSFGATTTAQLEYGTGSSCGTGTTALTGVYVPSTGTIWEPGNAGATFVKTIASNALCLVSTGTGGINGVLTYVQQ